MRKKLTCLLLIVVLLLAIAPTAAAADRQAESAAVALHDLGLFTGSGVKADGSPNYDLDRAPNRYEAVTMLVRLLGKENAAKSGTWETPFTDVADWAKPYVGYAYANGLTSGVGPTSYGGAQTVTASQYITFVLRALGYESGTDFSWDKAWELSDKIGLTEGQYGASTKSFLRGDVAIISNAALDTCYKGSTETLRARVLGGVTANVDFASLFDAVNADREAAIKSSVSFAGFENYLVSDPATVDLLTDAEINALITEHPTRQSVSQADALADVDLLFRALHNAYSAYYYFGADKFDAAEAEVKAWVQTQKTVNVVQLGQKINTALQFVQDAHFSIRPGEENVKQQKAWYSYIGTEQSFFKDSSGYYRMIDGEKWYVASLSNKTAEMSPVLRADGSLCYAPTLLRLGTAGSADTMTLKNGAGATRTDKIVWKANESLFNDDTLDRNSAYYHYLEENGILYLSIRSFNNRRFANTVLPEYAATGSKAKNCKLIIYDLRSNGGGDDQYARTWTQNFTGAKSVEPKVASANRGSKLGNAAAGFNRMTVGKFDGGISRGNWLPNDIPVIVLMDSFCGSSGESALTFAKTMDNVIVIGSNSAGYQICGNVYDYSLPRTGITACFGVSLSLYGSMDNVDYKGYAPDVWCNPKTMLPAVLNMIEHYDLGSAQGVSALRSDLAALMQKGEA